ncbi:MAG TPA: sodium:solute symporter family protein [Bacteroidota bacterium]|nr:sodium:solute symporter family protein [Bacteroidota bacterium]
MIYGMYVVDIIVIAVYLTVIMGIAIWASRRIKSREDYLLGGRKFGKVIQTFASFGQATSADGPVGVATTTFRNGAAGIWSSLLMAFSTPLFWITSPWQRRMRITTMGDFYEERYGSKKMAATYAIIAAVGMMGLISVGYTAMSKTVLAITPKQATDYTVAEQHESALAQELALLEEKDSKSLSAAEQGRLKELRLLKPNSVFSYIDESALIWGVCVIIMIHAMMGGLVAAFYTDMLQGTFIILLSIILIPFSWMKITAVYGTGRGESALKILHEKLPESFFEIFGSPTLIDFTWYFILTAALVAGITVVTQPNQLVTNAAAKDEQSARFGFVTGVFIKRFCTILWGVVGLSAVLLYTGKIQNSDLLWGYATHDLLGSLGFGLVGLMVASMMAALMATADSLMLTVSGLLLHNIYMPLVKNKQEQHYVLAGRILGGLFLIGGAIVATQFSGIFEILKFVWEFFVIFAAAFWLGLKWRRANRQGAWASILITVCVFYLFPVVLSQLVPAIKTNTAMLLQTQPDPVTRTYVAREIDVEQREKEIEKWQKDHSSAAASSEAPQKIAVGERYSKTFVLPSKAIFWSQQPVLNANGVLEARGYFFPELLLLQTIGIHLETNPYALNETIRMQIRLFFPFLILIVVSLMTKSNQDTQTDKFFLKMRTRVRGGGPEADARDVNEAYAHPEQTKAMLLFPDTSWEIYRWNKQDIVGFLVSIGIVFIVIGTLFVVVKVL